MAVLGEAYRILYISASRTRGLTDVQAVVLKPDLAQAGVFPMQELSGMFHGCYYYDYLSSISDPEGQYFSLVNSRTEGIEDIVRFQLLPGSGDDSNSIVIPPSAMVATIVDNEIYAVMNDESDLWTYVRLDQVRGTVNENDKIVGVLSDDDLSGSVNSNSTVATSRLDN